MAIAHSQHSQASIVRQISIRSNKFSTKWAPWILTIQKKARKEGPQQEALPLTTTALGRLWTPSGARLHRATTHRRVIQSNDEVHRPVEEAMATIPSQALGHPRGQ